MSLPEKAFPVSWDQFHRDARALAWRLAGSGPFESIVCITRGGLVPAAIVARELDLRMIETVCIASYHTYTEQGGLKVIKGIDGVIATATGIALASGRRTTVLLGDLTAQHDLGALVRPPQEERPELRIVVQHDDVNHV